MAVYSLLKMVQKTLRAMQSDNVNSISDTQEATDVANIIEDVYFEYILGLDLPEHRMITQATALGDTDLPTHMQIPTGMFNIREAKYNVGDPSTSELDYRDVCYVEPDIFMDRVHSRNSTDTDTNVVVTDYSGVKLIIDKTRYPSYFTSFDDNILVFDSYKATDESSLQQSKSLLYGRKIPAFTLTDDFVIDINETAQAYILNEVKSTAFVQLKQEANPKAEQQSRQQKVKLQNDRYRTQGSRDNRSPDYGRKR